MAEKHDFVITPGGPQPATIFLVEPHSPEALAWLSEQGQDREDWQRWGESLVVEHRYVQDFALALQDEGFDVVLRFGRAR